MPKGVRLVRAIVVTFVALALILVSHHGGLDRFAEEQVAGTTERAVGLYATAIVIYGVVSVLKSMKLDLFLGSAEVGQALDPVNDSIERLATSLTWAIGSLLFQRILLELTEHSALTWILTVIGVAVLLNEWTRSLAASNQGLTVAAKWLEHFRTWLIGMFVLAAVIRFVVPAFLALSFLFNQMFLESYVEDNREHLSQSESELPGIAGSSSPDRDSPLDARDLEENWLRVFR